MTKADGDTIVVGGYPDGTMMAYIEGTGLVVTERTDNPWTILGALLQRYADHFGVTGIRIQVPTRELPDAPLEGPALAASETAGSP